LAKEVDMLLRLASTCGKVMIVTLASRPWVSLALRGFLPWLQHLLEELDIEVIYAQEPLGEADSSASAKAKAMTRALENFYSQYEGQSWKNLISIGDSNNDRLGILQATEGYLTRAQKLPKQPKPAKPVASGPFIFALAEVSAAKLQSTVTENSAAKYIQRIWIGHVGRRIFRMKVQADDNFSGLSGLYRQADWSISTQAARIVVSSSSASTAMQSPGRLSPVSSPPSSPEHGPMLAQISPSMEPLFLDGCSTCSHSSDGHLVKVRTKLVTMVEHPTIQELSVQLRLITSWLPALVKIDRSLGVQLAGLESPEVIAHVESVLKSGMS